MPLDDPGGMATTTPSRDDHTGVRRRRTAPTSRWQKVVGIAGLAVVLWVGSEMYEVVFFDGTFPGGGQHAPIGNQDGDPAPPTTSPHDPSQFGH